MHVLKSFELNRLWLNSTTAREALSTGFMTRSCHNVLSLANTPPATQTRGSRLENRGVAVLVDIIKNEVEFTARLGQRRERIPHMNVYTACDAGTLEVPFCAFGVGRIGIGVVNFSIWSGGARQPQRRVADGRAELENALRMGRKY